MPKKSKSSRENKIMNSVANTSIILMSTLMDGFSEIMIGAAGAMAAGIAEKFGDEKSKDAEKEIEKKLPQVSDKMRSMISDIRKDLYEQMEHKRKQIKPFILDQIFDIGPQTIEKYDFGMPNLTQELDDSTIARYTYLLMSEDAKFSELFSLLGEWMNKLPQVPNKK
jgi:hypothetical protein